jgi:hypothetical protein
MLIMAHQVAGKAVRDGLFLSQFTPAALPAIMGAAALFSVLLGLLFARRMSRLGPARIVPAAFAIGGVLHWMEFGLLRSPGIVARGITVTVIYLHLVGLGAILLSGFWSIASETFDPRAAKRYFGKITGAGTAGGILGGLIAERVAAMHGVDQLLLVLGLLHIATWLLLRRVPAAKTPALQSGPMWSTAREAFRKSPFLANLAVLVLLGTVSAALIDYVFKSGAASLYGKGPQLIQYFAIFYTSTQVLSFLTQTFVTPWALRRQGLGRTMQWHPAAVGLGVAASMVLPSGVMAPVSRALELIFRGSFLRSSYELFFTPTPPREKRAVKTFIDVACDRMGDALGAGLLQALLLFGPGQILMPVLGLTALLAAVSLWLTRRMDAAYSRALEHGLTSRVVTLDEGEVADSTTLAVILRPTTAFPKRGVTTQLPAAPPAPVVPAEDPMTARIADLRSGSAERIRKALAPDQPFDHAIVPFAIRLLAWDPALEWARAYLLRHAHRAIGQLSDALLDPEQDFAVRRRIPQILAYTSSQRAVDALIEALTDPRFEIRFHCSRAIEFLHRMADGLRFDRAAIEAAVESELHSSRAIWEGRKLLDRAEGSDSQYWYLDSVVRERADKSLEHLFSLLAVMLPAEPLRAAFRGLHGEDRMLRGLALEFLELHLTREQVTRLRQLVDPAPAVRSASAGAPVTVV